MLMHEKTCVIPIGDTDVTAIALLILCTNELKMTNLTWYMHVLVFHAHCVYPHLIWHEFDAIMAIV